MVGSAAWLVVFHQIVLTLCLVTMVGFLLAVDFEDLKGQMKEDDMNKLESVVVAKMKDLESLCDAFRGCHAVFHTSSFVDPHGISGYSVS